MITAEEQVLLKRVHHEESIQQKAQDHSPDLQEPSDRTSDCMSELVVGDHPAMLQIKNHAVRAAHLECTVLITGETGTGKEVWARKIHQLGPRNGAPFIPVNCAALTLVPTLTGVPSTLSTPASGRLLIRTDSKLSLSIRSLKPRSATVIR